MRGGGEMWRKLGKTIERRNFRDSAASSSGCHGAPGCPRIYRRTLKLQGRRHAWMLGGNRVKAHDPRAPRKRAFKLGQSGDARRAWRIGEGLSRWPPAGGRSRGKK